MDWMEEKARYAAELVPRLYDAKLIRTICNSPDKEFRDKGWTLKNGDWSPWFVNLRYIGDHPDLLADVSYAMLQMKQNEAPDVTKTLGVSMAGIPIATALSLTAQSQEDPIPLLYTRELREKLRDPAEVKAYLDELRRGFTHTIGYGDHQFVEGTIQSGDVIAITDDLTTNIGSKAIAHEILEFEIDRRNHYRAQHEEEPITDIDDSHVFILLDREQGSAEGAEKLGMTIHSIIPFKSHGIDYLEDSEMEDDEFELVRDYVTDPSRYQDPEVIEAVLRTRKKIA